MFEKIMPRMFVYAYDPERIEEMLDRKSREGWQCYEVGLFYCFHRGEPHTPAAQMLYVLHDAVAVQRRVEREQDIKDRFGQCRRSHVASLFLRPPL